MVTSRWTEQIFIIDRNKFKFTARLNVWNSFPSIVPLGKNDQTCLQWYPRWCLCYQVILAFRAFSFYFQPFHPDFFSLDHRFQYFHVDPQMFPSQLGHIIFPSSRMSLINLTRRHLSKAPEHPDQLFSLRRAFFQSPPTDHEAISEHRDDVCKGCNISDLMSISHSTFLS